MALNIRCKTTWQIAFLIILCVRSWTCQGMIGSSIDLTLWNQGRESSWQEERGQLCILWWVACSVTNSFKPISVQGFCQLSFFPTSRILRHIILNKMMFINILDTLKATHLKINMGVRVSPRLPIHPFYNVIPTSAMWLTVRLDCLSEDTNASWWFS